MTAHLRRVGGERVSVLRAEHVIGRSARCDLQVEAEYVSGQHAAIRFGHDGWEIKDLGSRNGTEVDGVLLALGATLLLRKGMTVCLGDVREAWVVVDDSPPQVMAVSLDSEEVVVMEDDMLALPSSGAPEVVLFRAGNGTWELEDADGAVRPIEDQEHFSTSRARWLFCCPRVIASTSAVESRPNLRAVRLHFDVSRDEEHVELTAQTPARQISLGARAYNYLLVTLARHRMQDEAAGIVPSACGWIYVEDLLQELQVTPEQLNVDIFRIRKLFGSFGFNNASSVIERRPRTRQLRVGVAALSVQTI